MSFKSFLLTAAAFCCLSAPAGALTLINDDQDSYIVELIIGEGDSTIEKFELEYDFAADDICPEGCTIRLNNGTEMSFAGHELVTIRNGHFVIAE